MDKPEKIDYCCPIYRTCVGNGNWYRCVYAKRKGVPFTFNPKCYIEFKGKHAR